MRINCNRWFRIGGGGCTIIFLLLVLLCMNIMMTRGRVWAANIEILTPSPGATVLARNPQTHLVLRQSGPGVASQVRVEKSGVMLKSEEVYEGEEHNYLHFRLPLKKGLNIFTIIPGSQRLELTYQPLRGLLPIRMKKFYFFHQGGKLPESCAYCHDLQETETLDLVGLMQQTSCITCHKNLFDKNTWQHSTTVNQQCLSCHLLNVDGKSWAIGYREGKIDDTCLACHTGKKDWLSREFRHGAMIGGCTLCHNPHGGEYRYQLWAEGSLKLCIFCHNDKQILVDKENPMPYVHGIISERGCVACHNPHATDEEYMLHKPINELCISCHNRQEFISLNHPVAGHPVDGPKEPLRPFRKFTCTSCHEPHGSAHQFLLFETLQESRICRECHKF